MQDYKSIPRYQFLSRETRVVIFFHAYDRTEMMFIRKLWLTAKQRNWEIQATV